MQFFKASYQVAYFKEKWYLTISLGYSLHTLKFKILHFASLMDFLTFILMCVLVHIVTG